MNNTEVDKVLANMLTECTGVALCDSGGAYGRNWERQQGKTVDDFMKESEVQGEYDSEGNLEYYTISVFHYLRNQLELDVICREFNKINIPADNWDDERFYGVSAEGGKFLDTFKTKEQNTFNSYNGESALSQVIQGTYLRIGGIGYILLQIHGGCDVRGGYTTARLFRIDNEWGDGEYDWLCPEDVYGRFIPNGADLETPALIDGVDILGTSVGVIQFDNSYDGYSLRTEDNQPVELNQNKGKIELWLREY
jgi:hypothetical protein